MYLDSLTKINNRYKINEWFEVCMKNAEQQPFSIIFFDIDRFKEINDQYGHLIGDRVLLELTEVVQRSKNPDAFFGRWGGEEFILIVFKTEKEAYQIAEHIRKSIDAHSFPKIGRVTASFGVTEYRVGDTVSTLMERADQLLYQSKEMGRNRVTRSTE